MSYHNLIGKLQNIIEIMRFFHHEPPPSNEKNHSMDNKTGSVPDWIRSSSSQSKIPVEIGSSIITKDHAHAAISLIRDIKKNYVFMMLLPIG